MRRVILIMAVALALAGCGNDGKGDGVATAGGTPSSSGSASTGANSGTDDVGDQMRQFAACMREQGIDMPDPKVAENDGQGSGGMIFEAPGGGPAAGGPDPQKFEAAQKKCQHLMPDGGELAGPDPEAVERMRQFAKCMRENGVPNFPDPDENGATRLEPGNFDPRDPKIQEAQKKCAAYAPQPGGPSVERRNG